MDKRKALYCRGRDVLFRAQNIDACPFVAEYGAGAVLTDLSGKRYLDFSSGGGIVNTGYSHPRIVGAVTRQMEKLSFAPAISAIHESRVLLAEMLAESIPGNNLDCVWLGNSKPEAESFLAEAVFLATGKKRILEFAASGFGRVGARPALNRFRESRSEIKLAYPDCYRCPFEKEFGSCGLFCLRYIENYLFKAAIDPREIGAVKIEPFQCSGGDLVPAKGFLRGLERICRENEILLISDESQTGMGRTGKLYGMEHWGLAPDFVILAGSLASGQPIGAVAGKKPIMNTDAAERYMPTAGGTVSCAAAIETLRVIREECLTQNSAEMGAYLRQELEKLQQEYDFIGDIRGSGLLFGMDLVKDRTSRAPDSLMAQLIVYRAFELGLLIYHTGFHSNVLEMMPPLIIGKSDIDQAVCILKQSIEDVLDGTVTGEKWNTFSAGNV